jgi:hypothetical protein
MHRTMPTSTAGRGAEPVHTQPRAHPRPRRAERRGRGVALAAADGAPPPRPKLAVFVSGGGSNLRALHAATAAGGRVNADIAVRGGATGAGRTERRDDEKKKKKKKNTPPVQSPHPPPPTFQNARSHTRPPPPLPPPLFPFFCGHAQVVVSDVPGCGGWEWAAANGITTARFPPARGEPGGPGSPQADRDAAAAALAAALREGAGVEYVALAGYLKV